MGIYTNASIFTYTKDTEYKKPYKDKEDQSLHTFKKETIIPGVTTFNQEIRNRLIEFKEGSLEDTFRTTQFVSLYIEPLVLNMSYRYVSNIYNKHEWFRLFGTNEEEKIKNVYRIYRKSKDGIILINGIPIDYTEARLIEYDGAEYLAVSENNISTLAVLHCPGTEMVGKVSIFINRNGTLSLDSGDIKIGAYDDVMCITQGNYATPKNYVTIGHTALFTDLNNNLKITNLPVLSDTIHLNKVISFTDTSVKMYIPLKKSKSMFDNLTTVKSNIDNYATSVSSSYLWENGIKKLVTNIESVLSQISNTTNYMYMTPDIKEVPRNILSDGKTEIIPYIEKYLKDLNDIQRSFVLSKDDIYILEKQNPFDINMKSPKLLLPLFNETDKKVLLYFNGRLLTAKPEVIEYFGSQYIVLDMYDILTYLIKTGYTYTLKERRKYSFEEIKDIYQTILNEIHSTNTYDIDFSFEIQLYDNCKIIEGKFTKYNDYFIPLRYDMIDTIDKYELYIDGIRVDDFYLGEYGVSDLDTSKPAIPVMYIRNKGSIGTYTLILKDYSHRFVYRTIHTSSKYGNYIDLPAAISDVHLYYNTGHKINPKDIIEIVPGGYMINHKSVNDVTIKAYYRKHELVSDVADNYGDSTTNVRKINYGNYIFSTFYPPSGYTAWYYMNTFRATAKRQITLTNPLTKYNNITDYIFRAKYDFLLANCGRSSYIDTSAINISGATVTTGSETSVIKLSNLSAYGVSPFVFTAKTSLISGELALPVTDHYFRYKVAYLYSLWNASLVNMNETTLYPNRLFSINETSETSPLKYIDIPQEYIDKYNTIMNKSLTKESFSFSNLSSYASVFLLFDHLPYIPVPHGIFPEEWSYCRDVTGTRTTPTIQSFPEDSSASIKDVLTRSTISNIIIKV